MNFDMLLEAATLLPTAAQREFVERGETYIDQKNILLFWSIAGEINYASDRMLEFALRSVEFTTDQSKLIKAITYLARVDPNTLWLALTKPETITKISLLLAEIEPFEWYGIAQSLPDVNSSTDIEALKSAVANRQILLALDVEQVSAPSSLSDQFMVIRNKLVTNALLRLIALKGGDEAVDALLQLRSKNDNIVESLGALPDANSAYSAYLDWLLADIIGGENPGKNIRFSDDEMTAWILNSDPVSTRASAGLTLAILTQNASQ